MVAIIRFPDTNSLARKYLLQGLAEHGVTGIAVGEKLPSPMQTRFIRLFTLPGRATSRRTQWCTVIAQVYDSKGNDARCFDLAEKCAGILEAAPDMDVEGRQWISRPVERHGPYPSEDPDLMGIPRYAANITWTVQSAVVV